MTCRLLLTAAAFAAVSLPAFAQTAGADPARAFTDPNYLPTEGLVYGTTGYSYGSLDGHVFDSAGAERDSFTVTTNTIAQSFGYGVTDDVAIRLSDTYVPLATHTSDPVGGPSRSSDRSGLTDPEIGATWRVIDEQSNPVLVDLFANYAPDLISATAATQAHDGSAARGGQAGAVGVALGREWADFGIRGTASADWLGSREIEDNSSHITSREGSSWDYNLDLTSQARLDNQFSCNFGAGYTFRQSFDVTKGPGTTFTTHPGDFGNLHASVNYQLTPDASASLLYQFNDYADRTTDHVALPVLDTTTRDRKENVVGVQFDYALN
jgi:hypothetical protein